MSSSEPEPSGDQGLGISLVTGSLENVMMDRSGGKDPAV